MKKNGVHSRFWFGDSFDRSFAKKWLSPAEQAAQNIYKLSSGRKAIANFVNIVTGKPIPVSFATDDNSYTDGKMVRIGANVTKPEDFDSVVGCALHEGTHIVESDFNLLKTLKDKIPNSYYTLGAKVGLKRNEVHELVKIILNYVEDRRIDNITFTNSPGYRPYYHRFYDRYFYSDDVNKGLKSDSATDETIDSYLFRIINMHNANTRLDALKGLNEIFKLIDLKHIDRLKNTGDALMVAFKVVKVILSNIEKKQKENNQSKDSGDSSDNNSGSGSDDNSDSGSGSGGDSDSDDDSDSGDDSGSGSGDDSESNKKMNQGSLSDADFEKIKEIFDEIKKLVNGELKKETISDKVNKKIDSIDSSGSNVVPTGSGSFGKNKSVETIVIRDMNKRLFDNGTLPMAYPNYSRNAVNAGLRLGKILGKKLKVRSEQRDTIFNRQKVGKIDKRMIHSIGFGNENIFQFKETDMFKAVNVHISIDASGSMGGKKWFDSITMAVSVCVAAEMVPNLDVQVSFRTTTADGSERLPYVIIGYDSRNDKLSKIKELWPNIYPNGVTPEGLCFEAIMKDFLRPTNDSDSYFVNISDGQPSYYNYLQSIDYSGTTAINHTKKMVNKISRMGIEVLAYFVGNEGSSSFNAFKTMYGSSKSVLIDMNNVSQISRTLNKLFLTKN